MVMSFVIGVPTCEARKLCIFPCVSACSKWSIADWSRCGGVCDSPHHAAVSKQSTPYRFPQHQSRRPGLVVYQPRTIAKLWTADAPSSISLRTLARYPLAILTRFSAAVSFSSISSSSLN